MYKKLAAFFLIVCVAGFAAELLLYRTGAFEGDKKVIRIGIAGWQKGELPWDRVISEYERKHNVKIELSMVPSGSETSLLFYWSNDLTPFDVVCSLADEEIHPYIRKGLLIDFRKYLSREQLDKLVPATLAGSTVRSADGSLGTYCLPYQCEFMVMNYRKDIFDSFGIKEIPDTWAKLAAAAGRIKGYTENGRPVAPICMDFTANVFFGQNCFIPLLAEYKKTGIADSRGRLDIYGDEAIKVFVTLKEWYDKGLVSQSAMEGGQENDFIGGMGAVFCHWQTRGKKAMDMLENGKNKIAFAPIPGSRTAGALVSCYGAIIPKCSPVKDEAVRFCYEAFTTDMQPEVAAAGTLPCIRSLYVQGKVEPWMLGIYGMLENGYGFPDPDTWPRVRKILGYAFGKYMSGQMSPEEAIGWARKEVDELYKNLKERK